MDTTRIIEVNGIKLEVDLRQATRIDEFKVGDRVKLLKKEYGDKYVPYVGVIVGFDNFKTHPTIIVAYIKTDYNTASILFEYINSSSTDIELTGVEKYDIPFTKADVLDKLDKEILKKEEEVKDMATKRKYFLDMFGKYFKDQS